MNTLKFLEIAALIGLSLTACKSRTKTDLQEAGAGHLDNAQWFQRFDSQFHAANVASAIFRINTIGSGHADQIISPLRGWPESDKLPLNSSSKFQFYSAHSTGFLVSPEGYAISCHHCVKSCVGTDIFYNQPRKCQNLKAINGSAFSDFEVSETQINNELVRIANENMSILKESGKKLQPLINNEVMARVYLKTLQNTQQKTFDVCAISSSGGDIDAVLIKLVPQNADCSQAINTSTYFSPSDASEFAQGRRVYSAGFGSYHRLYSHHRDDSKSNFFDENKVNFATGLLGRETGSDISTVTDKSIYKNDENFEAMNTSSGQSGAPIFYDFTPERGQTMPPLVGVHYKASTSIRLQNQTGVSIKAVFTKYLRSNCQGSFADCLND